MAYFEPKSKAVHALAIEAAKAYFKDKKNTVVEFQGYQRGYINAYRRGYARTKLSMEGK